MPVTALPNPTLVVSAFCSACPWRTFRQDAHRQAQAHRDHTAHSVVVVETTTTTYQGAQ